MNKKTLLLIPLLMILALCSCAKDPDAPSGMKLASGEAVGYYMYVPQDWVVPESRDGVSSAYVSITDRSNVTCTSYDVFSKNKEIFELPAEKDESKPDSLVYAENYWKIYEEQLKTYLPSYRRITDPVSTLVDGRPALRCRYAATMSGADYDYDMILCIKDGMTAYLLTFTAESSKYSNDVAAFEQIVSSFVFREGIVS
ncbi:MAG: hypothetical protein J5879_08195 [Clostridia bacterium]|nr:hypothetical protein [Clostridia bacterium]